MATSTNPAWDPILLACQQNNYDRVASMLKDPSLSSSSSSTTYDTAANSSIVHHCNAIGQTPLHIASWWAFPEIVELLLEYGANVMAPNTLTGATPIHCVIQSSQAAISKSRRLKCIEILLDHLFMVVVQNEENKQQPFSSFDRNGRDLLGRTPLDYLEEDDIDRKDIEALFHTFESKLESQTRHPIFDDLQSLLLGGNDYDNETDLGGKTIHQHVQEIQQAQKSFLPTTQQDQTPLLFLVQQWIDESATETDTQQHQCYLQAFDAMLPLYCNMNPSREEEAAGDEKKREDKKNQEQEEKIRTPLQQQQIEQVVIVLDMLLGAILDLYVVIERNKGKDSSNNNIESKDTRLLKQWQSAVAHLMEQTTKQNSKPTSRRPSVEVEERIWMTISRRNYLDLADWYWSTVVVANDADSLANNSAYWSRIQNRQGMTPVQFAARSGHLKLVEWFLLEGNRKCIDLSHQDNQGITALDAARTNRHDEIAEIIMKYQEEQ